jgi:hypothetical protein
VTTHTDPLFCDTKLARRIELAEVDLICAANSAARRREAPGFLIPVAGGVASFADHGSPYNKVAGLPDGEELDRVEHAFATYDAPTQVELALIPQSVRCSPPAATGSSRSRNVLGRPLDGSEAPLSLPDVEIRRSLADDDETWPGVMADAAAHPDTEGVPWHEDSRSLRILRAHGHTLSSHRVRRCSCQCWTARRNRNPSCSHMLSSSSRPGPVSSAATATRSRRRRPGLARG